MHRLRTCFITFLFPLLLLAFLWLTASSLQPAAITAQSGVSNFTTIVASRDIHAGGDVLLDGFLTLNPGAAISLTMNGFVTPTGTLQTLTSAGAVATSGARIAVQPAGSQLILLNVGAQTITFTETGTLVSAGNIALGAGDSATLISNGVNWYQVGASNN